MKGKARCHLQCVAASGRRGMWGGLLIMVEVVACIKMIQGKFLGRCMDHQSVA